VTKAKVIVDGVTQSDEEELVPGQVRIGFGGRIVMVIVCERWNSGIENDRVYKLLTLREGGAGESVPFETIPNEEITSEHVRTCYPVILDADIIIKGSECY